MEAVLELQAMEESLVDAPMSSSFSWTDCSVASSWISWSSCGG